MNPPSVLLPLLFFFLSLWTMQPFLWRWIVANPFSELPCKQGESRRIKDAREKSRTVLLMEKLVLVGIKGRAMCYHLLVAFFFTKSSNKSGFYYFSSWKMQYQSRWFGKRYCTLSALKQNLYAYSIACFTFLSHLTCIKETGNFPRTYVNFHCLQSNTKAHRCLLLKMLHRFGFLLATSCLFPSSLVVFLKLEKVQVELGECRKSICFRRRRKNRRLGN